METKDKNKANKAALTHCCLYLCESQVKSWPLCGSKVGHAAASVDIKLPNVGPCRLTLVILMNGKLLICILRPLWGGWVVHLLINQDGLK